MTIIEALKEEGSTYASVARKLSLPYAQVRREALAAGVVRKRGSGRRRVFYKIDDNKLKALVADGLGLNAIAEHFSCTKQAVWAAKRRLGIPSIKDHDAPVATDSRRS